MKNNSLIFAFVAILLLIVAGIGLSYSIVTVGNAKYQLSIDLSMAQDSIVVRDNQLASKNSDIRGLRTEKRNLQNHLSATEELFTKRLRELQLKYESALTRGENLRSLSQYYHGFKLQLEVADAQCAEHLNKLWLENFQLKQQLAIQSPK